MFRDPAPLRWLAAALVLGACAWATPTRAQTPAKPQAHGGNKPGKPSKAASGLGPGRSHRHSALFIPAGVTVTTTGKATAKLGLGLAFPGPRTSRLVFATTLEANVRTEDGVASLLGINAQGNVSSNDWTLALSGQAWVRHGKDTGASILPVAYVVAGIGVGRQTFDYLSVAPAKVVTIHDGVVRTPLRAGALGYWIVKSQIPHLSISMAARVGYVRSWAASSDIARVCTDLGVVSGGQGNVSACRDEVLGAPAETSGAVFEAQFGPVIELSDRFARTALDVAFEPDASGENLSFGLPVYLSGSFLGHFGTIAVTPRIVLPLAGSGQSGSFTLTLDLYTGIQAFPSTFAAHL